MMKRAMLGAAVGLVLVVFLAAAAAKTASKNAPALLEKADGLFAKKNYKDAAAAYESFLKSFPKNDKWFHASKRVITCKLRLRLFDEALAAAEAHIARCKGTPLEARAERLAGNLYMLIPHWGTRAGGKFYRARHKQGIRLQSYRYDKKRAVAHMERARELYAKYDASPEALKSLSADERARWHDERIECIFDLASLCSRFGIYENGWQFWYSFWGERDEFLAETAGEKDFDEYHGYWQLKRKRPIGLRLDSSGRPVFPAEPKKYAPELTDDQKILFLLAEARGLDRTGNGKYRAMSYYRQAMLARSRFGMDRLNACSALYYSGGRFPLKEELESFKPWELKDSEGLVLAGGRIRKVVLPPQWNVMQLLRIVAGDHPASGMADQAQYALGLYSQSRQQYDAAIAQYRKLIESYPKSKWARSARTQIDRIRAKQLRIGNAGVQLSGEPAKLQVSYRNTSKIHFVARRIDHRGFMERLRGAKPRGGHSPEFYALRNWHAFFVHGSRKNDRITDLASKYVGPEVARWSDEVVDDGSMRYARATLQTPLTERGAYLIYAYLVEPPEADKQVTGAKVLDLAVSRAVFVLTDLAIVEKKTARGNLYFICDARTGAPVSGAKVDVLHHWSTWDRKKRKSIYHTEMHNLVTDKDGCAVLSGRRNNRGSLHVLVDAGEGRLAWSGMSYWSRYYPSRAGSGLFAYCITDRPVYRPEQTVRFKVWLRRMHNGALRNVPDRPFNVTVYDPRGNTVYSMSKRVDQFGGVDGQFRLGAEPPLGVYRLYVAGGSYVGGQNFRVEEYKKPEFEITVEPSTTHAKLGGRLTAVIKAKYYFGAPVTDATVSYKVFREEYTHGYYFPGRWDWLYGAGYGQPWYEYPWFSWWSRARCCWVPPRWWWGFYGGAPEGVRELVKQGSARIGPDGTVKVEIDTASAARDHADRDHRYVIKAEVRDASRRVITGEGAVKVTRGAYYAFVRADRGYYRPGEEMTIRVRCLTPENAPVKVEGLLTVSSIVFGGPDNARIEEKEIKRWKASTDARGALEFKLRYEKSGQLKIKFEAPDEWGGVVAGYGLVWVCGRDFDGRLYRFNDLELITDKRTYRPGETAHLMINADRAGSTVLFSDDVDNNHLLSWRVLRLNGKQVILDIPIKNHHRPNFFVEATTVSDARVHSQLKRICVPPEQGVVDVTVAADKSEYKPGEKATVKVTARTLDGKAVSAQVVLSAFDKSVLYIQPEYTPPIARFFHGRLRRHYVQMSTNLHEQFSAQGYVHRPFRQLQPYPESWWGLWGPSVGDWRSVGDDEIEVLSSGEAGALRGMGDRLVFLDAAVGGKYAMMKSKGGAMPPMAAEAEARRSLVRPRKKEAKAPAETFAPAKVRKQFADTALWVTSLVTDADGTATVSFEMPENLTTWKINAWAMTRKARVGQADTSAVTTKNLLVRLQGPRFFLEYDEVVLSANVHNYLDSAKTAKVSLDIGGKLLKIIGETPATTKVKVPAGGEVRVDWRVKVLKEGEAKITVRALTDEESDAMRMTFPVLVHGVTRQVATTGYIRPDEREKTVTVELDVPAKRRPELSRLEVRFAPSLVGAMMDALPYCLDYPYGCTEQTMSRFLPAVLTLKTLRDMGIRLEDVRRIRGRLAEVERIEKGERRWSYARNPVFEQRRLDEIIAKGLSRIANMQHGDGGWGWWTQDSSSPYMTAYVLYALAAARECDVKVARGVIDRGMKFLKRWEEGRMRRKHWSVHTQHAFSAYVLSMQKLRAAVRPVKGDKRPPDLIERLYRGRDKLNLYGKALLSLACANLGEEAKAKVLLENIMQYKQENDETQVAWFRTPEQGWWYWWNSDIETHAWILRALAKLEPKSPVAPRIVKWLLNNRRNGYYWRSTRDTTLCVAAMSDFVVAAGEARPDYTLTIDYDDGASKKTVRIDKDSFFTFDNRFVLEGDILSGGKHTLKITKKGTGAVYFNTYLRYFTKEEHIEAAGHELKVARSYFKLVQIPYVVEVEDAEGRKIKEKRLRYKRVPVKDGDTVASGDVLQVELKVASDNDYTYLAFEDPKPAGFEPTRLRSGAKGQEGFCSYMELRDEKTVFFINTLGPGEHLLRYRLRAEIPGVFHALPTTLYGMYVPEMRANGDEHVIRIVD